MAFDALKIRKDFPFLNTGKTKDLLYFDAGIFVLSYTNRIGTTLLLDSATFQLIRFRTNIGKSRNAGIEMVAEIDWLKLIKKENKHKAHTEWHSKATGCDSTLDLLLML